jgi:hypothetical protein
VSCSSVLSAQRPGANSPSNNNQRKASEKLAAAIAADLGFQLHLWAESAAQAPGAASSAALAADGVGLDVASQVVNVTLAPKPADAASSLPKDPGQRSRVADAAVSQWLSQVREQLRGMPYLDVHFAIGNSVGAIRTSLAVKYGALQTGRTSPAEDRYMLANVAVIDAVLHIPDVELTAAQRSAWATLKEDLRAPQLTSQRVLALRGRLEDWYKQFVATIRSRAK